MCNNDLQIRKLFYKNMGDEPYYLRNFYETAEYLDESFSEMTLQVIRLLLGDMHACDMYDHCDSYIKARIQFKGIEYTVEVLFKDHTPCFQVTDPQGKDHTLDYLKTITCSPEEQELTCFPKPGLYPKLLHWYLETEQNSAVCSIRKTWRFRHYLRRFIRSFKPELLRPDKDLWLHIEKDGRFVVKQNSKDVIRLAETDRWIFHYLCFLHLRRFWNGLRKRSRFPAPVLPLMIRDFSDRLDESVSFTALLSRATELSQQVVIL